MACTLKLHVIVYNDDLWVLMLSDSVVLTGRFIAFIIGEHAGLPKYLLLQLTKSAIMFAKQH